MKTFLELSPAAQALLLYVKEIEAQAGQELLLTALVAAMSRKGLGIRETIVAVGDCTRGGWLYRSPVSRTQPDHVALTNDGAGMLLCMP